jgi:cobalt-zinc-cadmium efflux system protein
MRCSRGKPLAPSGWANPPAPRRRFVVIDATVRARRRSLLIALSANAAFLVVELVGGLLFHSLALVADAFHLTSDVLALGLAFVALALAQRPPTERHTFGFERAEVLAAQANGVLLLAGAIGIVIEGVRRLGTPEHMDAGAVLVIGVGGLVVNVGSAAVLARSSHGNLNMRAAFWHLAMDALGSVAVIVAAIGTLAFGAERLDAIASLFIAVLIVIAAWHLLRETTRVLLDAAPPGIDVASVSAALAGEDGVEAVHHLHVWTMGSERPALSAHVVLTGPLSLHDAQERATELKGMLATQFGIQHTTLEVECHACIEDHVHGTPSEPARHGHHHDH